MSSVSGDGHNPIESGASPAPEVGKYNPEDHSFSLTDNTKVYVRDFRFHGQLIEREAFSNSPEIQKAAADILGKVLKVKSNFTEAQVKVNPQKTTTTYMTGPEVTHTHTVTYADEIYERISTIMKSLTTAQESASTPPKESPPALSPFTRLKNTVAALFRRTETAEHPMVKVPIADVPKREKLEAEKGKLAQDISNLERNPRLQGQTNSRALDKISKERKQVDNQLEQITELAKKLSAEEKRLHEELPNLSQEEGQAKVDAFLEKWKNVRLLDAMNGNKWAALNIREALAKGLVPKAGVLSRFDTDIEAKVNEQVQEKRALLDGLIKATSPQVGESDVKRGGTLGPRPIPVEAPFTSVEAFQAEELSEDQPSKVSKLAGRVKNFFVSMYERLKSSNAPMATERAEFEEVSQMTEEESEVADVEIERNLKAPGEEIELPEVAAAPADFRLEQVFKGYSEEEHVEAMRKFIKHAIVGPKGKGGNPQDLQKLFVKFGGDLKGNVEALAVLQKAIAASFERELIGTYVRREKEFNALIDQAFDATIPESTEAQYGRMMFMNELVKAATGKKRAVLEARLEKINENQKKETRALMAEITEDLETLEKQSKALENSFHVDFANALEKTSEDANKVLNHYIEQRTLLIKSKIELDNKRAFLATRGLALMGKEMELNRPPVSLFVFPEKSSFLKLLDSEMHTRQHQIAKKFAKEI